MSDTTAYLAGCATTGVAALVLLVARVGMVSANNTEADNANRLDARIERIETTTSERQNASQARAEQATEAEIRKELEKQRDLTQQLEAQLSEQEALSQNLEAQIQEQEDKTKDLLSRIQDYQRSVEDMEIEDKIAAATRPADTARSAPPASLVWLGAGVVVVLVMGGGGLILCAVLLVLQSQRRSARPMHMPQPMPMPPATGYRYYNPAFLPPPQFPPRQTPTYYDYPPPPYDYTP